MHQLMIVMIMVEVMTMTEAPLILVVMVIHQEEDIVILVVLTIRLIFHNLLITPKKLNLWQKKTLHTKRPKKGRQV